LISLINSLERSDKPLSATGSSLGATVVAIETDPDCGEKVEDEGAVWAGRMFGPGEACVGPEDGFILCALSWEGNSIHFFLPVTGGFVNHLRRKP
jgi:hypothetical protein